MTRVVEPTVAEPPRRDMFSNARIVGGQFFLSGMHAGGPSGPGAAADTHAQAVEAFRRMRALTEACGATVDDIVVLRIYLTDIDDRSAVGRARSAVFSGDFPCSTLVEVSALVEPGLTVEVEAQGFLPTADHPGRPFTAQ
ncbi:RidA family protein [Gordonia insulae]|uniref:2-iminobutanoate/2-iminopropanoate deaminase n=1 Tax=Gordonia insulae TaxID=2420509 RepID=A0A3G8JQX2_9ACTN|nr:RidA family protein [Gordonia insulae]AZG47333.1 2-iminobutanoate/2-iminopropanoate deaminase [Gordonia insulae]